LALTPASAATSRMVAIGVDPLVQTDYSQGDPPGRLTNRACSCGLPPVGAGGQRAV
jgi:hypothetical protein